MATTIDYGNLAAYSDQMSFELISKAVLQTNVSEYLSLRSGLKAGTTTINLLDGDLGITNRTCGWTAAGSLAYSQVDLDIEEWQTKMSLCPTDLRDYYLAEQLSASANGETYAYEEVLGNMFVEKINAYVENKIAVDIFATLVEEIVNNVNIGTVNLDQQAVSTVETILDDVLDVIDAVPAKADKYGNKAVLLSPTMFKKLRRALVANNLFHFDPSANTDMVLEIPGTDYVAVKGTFAGDAGTVSANQFIAGPMEMIVQGVGLEDDFDQLKMFYSQDNDEVRVMAAFRFGIGVGQTDLFARNSEAL